ncbi:putative tail fiber protein [Klebsiella phage vB_KpnP_Emp27]|uniref:Putative tail fiber protein n=1 Tax=Klebsiella phage vB_KpnP_Emp27 TaxID=2591364 RepID=A0A5B9NCP3_9CAUD|nr:putative tail fiber protein [Klebsiella phage vB_KpnP_Emp27]
MATTIKTVMTYPLDGSTTDFNIPFEYLARKFVRVTLIGVDRKELILNQDYRFATKTTISTTRALGPADGYTLIEIRRFTSATDRLVDFTDGSILRAYDLNISQVQTLHVAEEARDLTADTIGVNNDGNLDARGRRIVNVADAQDVGDAVNLGQIQRWNDSALNSANRAKQEADRATARASEAATSAGNSASSASLSRDWAIKESPVEGTFKSSRSYALDSMAYRDASKSSADASAASAGAAKTSEINAKNSEIATKTSETNAKTSETNAKASEERAIEEANKLENMNDLAGAIEEVLKPDGATSGKVVWKYDIDSKVLRAYNGMSLGWYWDGKGSSPFFNFYRGQGEPSGSLRLDANKVVRFNGMNSVDFDSTINARAINGSWIHSTGDLVADATLYVHGGDYIKKDKWVPSGANKMTNLIRGSVDGFACDEYFTEIVGYYIERGWHLVGGDNDTWMRIKGNGNFEISGNRGARIVINGGAIVEQDGNIRGAIWDGKWLKDFMEDRYLTNIWIGAGRSRHVGQQTWEGWIDNGCVMRGIKQIRAGGDSFIEELYFNEIWKATARGQWII